MNHGITLRDVTITTPDGRAGLAELVALSYRLLKDTRTVFSVGPRLAVIETPGVTYETADPASVRAVSDWMDDFLVTVDLS